MTEGRLPEPDAPHEFTASPDFLALTGAEIGDQFSFISITESTAAESGFDAEEPDGPTFDATLVGVVAAPVADLQDAYAAITFPLSVLDEGSIGVAATESLVSLVDGADVADLRQQLDTLPDGANLTLDPAEWVDAGAATGCRHPGQRACGSWPGSSRWPGWSSSGRWPASEPDWPRANGCHSAPSG